MGATASLHLPRPFGPYELVRQLAVGGMAEIFMARARGVAGFEKVVALKMIHPRFSEDPEFARLLVEEANITAQLSHRNIVQVIDLGQIDETHYIAMEYVDGMDLSRLMSKMRERGQRATPRFAAFIVREVCDGLEHAHRKIDSNGNPLKIIHRDVSPPNILISNGGEVKLTDFGIAKAALRASSTAAGVVKGKYGYMPPEQARGLAIDHRADIFSAGSVLYELATGYPLYKEAPLPILLERVTRAVFEPPEKVKPDLPPALLDVLHRALAPKAVDRFPSARAMADALNTYLYTLPPNPEMEVAKVLAGTAGSTRASVPPITGDEDTEGSTQIESMAVLREKMLQVTEAHRRAESEKIAPFADEPTRATNVPMVDASDDEPEATLTVRPGPLVAHGPPPTNRAPSTHSMARVRSPGIATKPPVSSARTPGTPMVPGLTVRPKAPNAEPDVPPPRPSTLPTQRPGPMHAPARSNATAPVARESSPPVADDARFAATVIPTSSGSHRLSSAPPQPNSSIPPGDLAPLPPPDRASFPPPRQSPVPERRPLGQLMPPLGPSSSPSRPPLIDDRSEAHPPANNQRWLLLVAGTFAGVGIVALALALLAH